MEFWFDARFAAESKKAAKPRISTGFKDDVCKSQKSTNTFDFFFV